MKGFLHFYSWGMEVKLYMSIYTAAVVFFQGITEVLQGRYSISVWVLLEMLLVSFGFAAIQYAVLPAGNWTSKKGLAVWVISANVLYIGGALVFGWFPGVPLWGDILLIAMLECGLWTVWFGEQVACWRDTRALNRSLRQFQQES